MKIKVIKPRSHSYTDKIYIQGDIELLVSKTIGQVRGYYAQIDP